jgi:hypothetical protein
MPMLAATTSLKRTRKATGDPESGDMKQTRVCSVLADVFRTGLSTTEMLGLEKQ